MPERASERGNAAKHPPTAINDDLHRINGEPSPHRPRPRSPLPLPNSTHRSETARISQTRSNPVEELDDRGIAPQTAGEEGAPGVGGGATCAVPAVTGSGGAAPAKASSPEGHAEMLRVVVERFPDRSEWGELLIRVIHTLTFSERARFAGDEGGMDYELLFWAIQEAESPDPEKAAKWVFFKSWSPARLNIRPPSMVGLARIPREFLAPGDSPPRIP